MRHVIIALTLLPIIHRVCLQQLIWCLTTSHITIEQKVLSQIPNQKLYWRQSHKLREYKCYIFTINTKQSVAVLIHMLNYWAKRKKCRRHSQLVIAAVRCSSLWTITIIICIEWNETRWYFNLMYALLTLTNMKFYIELLKILPLFFCFKCFTKIMQNVRNEKNLIKIFYVVFFLLLRK